MNSKLIIAIFVVASLISISCAGRKNEENQVRNHFSMVVSKCMKTEEHSGQLDIWGKLRKDCQLELSNNTNRDAQGKKKNRKRRRMCMQACVIKKLVFPDSNMRMDAFKNFAKNNLTEKAQESFLKQIDACVVSKSITFENFSIEDKCKSWRPLNKCIKKSLRRACRIALEMDSTASDTEDENLDITQAPLRMENTSGFSAKSLEKDNKDVDNGNVDETEEK